jgi:hypothetical protein
MQDRIRRVVVVEKNLSGKKLLYYSLVEHASLLENRYAPFSTNVIDSAAA